MYFEKTYDMHILCQFPVFTVLASMLIVLKNFFELCISITYSDVGILCRNTVEMILGELENMNVFEHVLYEN